MYSLSKDWFRSFAIVHLITDVSIAFMNHYSPDKQDLPRSRQLESSDMRGNSEIISTLHPLRVPDQKVAGSSTEIGMRISDESSMRKVFRSDATSVSSNEGFSNGGSSNEGSSNGGSYNGASSNGGSSNGGSYNGEFYNGASANGGKSEFIFSAFFSFKFERFYGLQMKMYDCNKTPIMFNFVYVKTYTSSRYRVLR